MRKSLRRISAVGAVTMMSLAAFAPIADARIIGTYPTQVSCQQGALNAANRINGPFSFRCKWMPNHKPGQTWVLVMAPI